MAQAKDGDKVRVHYSRFLDEDDVVDSSYGEEPLEFTLGQRMVIQGIESAVIGMKEGDTKEVLIATEDAFGPRKEELIIDVERSQIPTDIDIEIGKVLQIRSDEGNVYNVAVLDIDDNNVKLDGNHPLAGEELKFKLELIEIL
jgi:peptidylprolyl isomerase